MPFRVTGHNQGGMIFQFIFVCFERDKEKKLAGWGNGVVAILGSIGWEDIIKIYYEKPALKKKNMTRNDSIYLELSSHEREALPQQWDRWKVQQAYIFGTKMHGSFLTCHIQVILVRVQPSLRFPENLKPKLWDSKHSNNKISSLGNRKENIVN